MEERASALNVRDSSPTPHVTGQTVTCSKQPGTRAKPSWDHQWCQKETASSTALSLQSGPGRKGWLCQQSSPTRSFPAASSSQQRYCADRASETRGKVIDYSLQCPSYCPKCTGSCSTQLCLQSPCRTSTAQDPHHQTRTDERHPEGDNICAQAAP